MYRSTARIYLKDNYSVSLRLFLIDAFCIQIKNNCPAQCCSLTSSESKSDAIIY